MTVCLPTRILMLAEKISREAINPQSKEVVLAYLEPGMENVLPDDRYQFERHGYFVADRVDTKQGKPVFNRAVTLRDSWGK